MTLFVNVLGLVSILIIAVVVEADRRNVKINDAVFQIFGAAIIISVITVIYNSFLNLYLTFFGKG